MRDTLVTPLGPWHWVRSRRQKAGNQEGIRFLFLEKPAQQKEKHKTKTSHTLVQGCFHCYSSNQNVSVVLHPLPTTACVHVAAAWIPWNPWRMWVTHGSYSSVLICRIQESISECRMRWQDGLWIGLFLIVFIIFTKAFSKFTKIMCSFPSAKLYQEHLINFFFISSFFLSFPVSPYLPHFCIII